MSIEAGLCQCGCGRPTSLAPYSSVKRGWVIGRPLRFVKGHYGRMADLGEGPNPSGLCMCGCGEKAPIARQSRTAWGHVRGKPVRYITGHCRRPEPVIDPATGCWIWAGNVHPVSGRPYTRNSRRDGKLQFAYRWFYERHVGPIPEGFHIHHKCENPACVNPDHLEPLTPAEHGKRHAKAV